MQAQANQVNQADQANKVVAVTQGDGNMEEIYPHFRPRPDDAEAPGIQGIIAALDLVPHMEGGYFAVTDLAEATMPSPHPREVLSPKTLALAGGPGEGFDPAVRRLSSTIHYYLTPKRPQGSFHRNRSRIIHTLHRGRGRYVLIHPDGRVETFVVGADVKRGERIQWVVEGGVWKASFLLFDTSAENEGLLISETVVPGFEYVDHEFLTKEQLGEIVDKDMAKRMGWLVKK